MYALAGKACSPFTIGTFEDLKLAGIAPKEGLRLAFYNDDADDSGNPDDLWFEGTLHYDPRRGWGAIVDDQSFRSESADQLRARNEPQS